MSGRPGQDRVIQRINDLGYWYRVGEVELGPFTVDQEEDPKFDVELAAKLGVEPKEIVAAQFRITWRSRNPPVEDFIILTSPCTRNREGRVRGLFRETDSLGRILLRFLGGILSPIRGILRLRSMVARGRPQIMRTNVYHGFPNFPFLFLKMGNRRDFPKNY